MISIRLEKVIRLHGVAFFPPLQFFKGDQPRSFHEA